MQRYRRALWIVFLLNAGFGVVEMAGGFLSASQALKADALDFLGDGCITLLGIAALAWPQQKRAGVALLQGIFLGMLGAVVLAMTIYRLIVTRQPDAEVMGILGAVGLAINVTAAVVLIPHRSGDVNARAIWLFSRNDALGNIAVIISAGLVALTGTPWPDLAAAIVMATLFLTSSGSIIRKAKVALRGGSPQ